MEDGCEWGPARRPVNVRELSRGLSAAGRQIAPQIPYCIKYLFHQEFNINFWVIVRENVWINLWRLDSHCINRSTRMKPWFSACQLMIVVPSIKKRIHHNGQMHLGLLHIPWSDLKKINPLSNWNRKEKTVFVTWNGIQCLDSRFLTVIVFQHFKQDRQQVFLEHIKLAVWVVLGESANQLTGPPTNSIVGRVQAGNENEKSTNLVKVCRDKMM